MTRRAQKRFPRLRTKPAPRIPVVHVFDVFTADDIKKGTGYKDEVLRLLWDHYASLQHQRSAASEAITAALAQAAIGPYAFNRWMRVVDYQFTNHPLSAVGSIRSMTGGRFNIGDIDPIKFAPFPALYLASDHQTAMAEKFGQSDDSGRLTRGELALRTDRSYSCVALNGKLETVIDLSKMERLTAFVEIIRQFTLPADVRERAKRMGRPNRLVSSVEELAATLLVPHWRGMPTLASVPHSSQTFGQLVAYAGIEGILFPSTRSPSGGTSLAVFPQNLGGDSLIELADPAPDSTEHRRLDAKTWRSFVC